MSSVNKAILIGNLGRDPEVRYTPSGTAMCKLSLATSEKWTDKASGEKREHTEWHTVQVFDKLAEICGQYLRKGKKVYIEGRLRTRKWEDKEGVTRYSTEILASDMRMLGGREDDESEDHPSAAPSPGPRSAAQRTPAPPPQRAPAPSTGTGFDAMDDDIPW